MALTMTTGKSHARRIATWTGETTAGSATIERYAPHVSLVCAAVQVSGTFGSATVVLQGHHICHAQRPQWRKSVVYGGGICRVFQRGCLH